MVGGARYGDRAMRLMCLMVLLICAMFTEFLQPLDSHAIFI